MNSSCDKIREAAADFVTGVLDKSAVKAFEDHLASCDGCRSYLRSLSNEEELLTSHFGRFEGDMEKGEAAVIRAIDRLELPAGFGIFSTGRLFFEGQFAKHGFAAVVIVVSAIYFAVTLSWISQITACIRQSM